MTPGRRRLIVLSGTAIAVLFVVWVFDRHYRYFDMAIYQGAIRWWLADGELYEYQAPVRGLLGFTYPPFAALVLLPTAMVSTAVAGALSTVLSMLALGMALWALGVRRKAVLALTFVALLATEPIRQTLGLGQVNLLLFALVVLDLMVLGRRGSRWTGIGVGIATAIKLTPALFIVYLLVTRRWRAAGVAAGTFAGLTVAAGLLVPRETWQYFGELVWRTGRVGSADAVANQALSGLLTRLSETNTTPAFVWVAVCAAVAVAGLRRAAQAHGYGEEVAALTLVGLTANLITPIAWTHHLVFLPIALLVLAKSGRWRDVGPAAAGYALCVLSPIWWAGDNPLAANTFVLMMLVLVWRLPVRPEPAVHDRLEAPRDHAGSIQMLR